MGSAPELGGREAVTRCLGALAAAELTPRLEGRPHVEHLFKHAVTRDVVYESMTHARRAQIHEQVARFVERAHTDDLDQQLEALAHHYGLSRNVAKKRIYLRQAGIAAKDAYANDAALDHFRRLAPLLKPAERGEIQRHIGEIHQHTGDWEAAQRAYRAALNQPATRAERAAARCHLGHLLSLRESYDDALPLLDQARSDSEQLGSDSLGSVLEYLDGDAPRPRRSDHRRETASEQLRVADAAANLAARSSAADSLGLVHWYEAIARPQSTGSRPPSSRRLGLAVRRAIIHANNDLAGLCWERNDHARAMACLNEGFAAASEIGYRYALGVVAGNAGELHRRRGEVEAALRCYRFELEVCEELGDRAGLLSVAGDLRQPAR